MNIQLLTDDVNRFSCILCDNKDFRSRGGLRRHANKKHKISDFGMKCSDCNEQFFLREEYNLHITTCGNVRIVISCVNKI